ncbi:MAG: hypothetical protein LKI39_06100 [Bacteroides sp.]|jgi:hypothetical protein|nr:hypothetical protein [Bacteroides sp.]MCI1682113.1 hypothetical protein [Bacteroides sp.]
MILPLLGQNVGSQWIRKEGENIYIISKLDSTADILYWFKKCMFNELFTFYKVALIDDRLCSPSTISDSIPMTLLNWAYSDNIGPFDINGGGWCGGNHSYKNEIRTARNVSYRVFINGFELKHDTLALSDNIKIIVKNDILNPVRATEKEGISSLNDIFCIESVTYEIIKNNIQVSVKHEYKNESPVIVRKYYGMQSMFENEVFILTANGQYYDWTPISKVSRFTKQDYPYFRCFIEKNSIAYQSSYLLKDGLGNHAEVSDSDVVFIGNSYGKCYHKLISDQSRKYGDFDFWSGVYTWFRTPLKDNDNILCYEGIINGQDAIFVNCKRKGTLNITLPEKYKNRNFMIMEKIKGIDVRKRTSSIDIYSHDHGSCVILFASNKF